MKRGLLALMSLTALATLTMAACSPGAAATATPTRLAPTNTPGGSGTPTAAGVVKPGVEAGAAAVFTVNLKEGPYAFNPKDLNLETGKRYHFKLVGEKEDHTFTVDALDIDVTVTAGQTLTFDYTPGPAGTHKLICIPHEAAGMVGTVVVK